MDAQEIITNIHSIYAQHVIPKNLERHMYLVTGVAEQIVTNFKEPIDVNAIIATTLIHDLGNIIKMNLSSPERLSLLDKEDQVRVNYLREKQKEYHQRYGTNAEDANVRIAQDGGVSKKVLSLLDPHVIFFDKNSFVINPDVEKQIILYADLRVSPQRVVSLEERLTEYAQRYAFHTNPALAARSAAYMQVAKKLEKSLFTHVRISPESITMDSTLPLAKKYGWKEKIE